jgi:PAS domain S-box-containing protein
MKKLWIGIGVLLLVLLGNAYIRQQAMQRVVYANDRVQHTEQVLFQVARVQSLLVDAETGQRGYLYTQDARYLDPYKAAVGEFDSAIDKLVDITRDNPEQSARVVQVRELARQKLQELQTTIQLDQTGQAEQARSVVSTNAGKNVMDEIRTLLGEIAQVEQHLQAERAASAQHSTRQAYVAFLLATGIGCLAILSFGWLLAREMTHRQTAAAELFDQKEWFATTLHSIGDAVIATDRGGAVTFLNDVAMSLTGFSSQEAQGKDLKEVFPIVNENTRAAVEDPVEKVIRYGSVVGLANHTILLRRDGAEIAIDDSAAPIRNSAGELIGVVLVFRDVSKQRELEEGLRRADKLATAGRFAATIAHEINNPLEAAINSLYLLNTEPGLRPESRRYLATAEQELARVAAVARQTLGFYRDTEPRSAVFVPQMLDEIVAVYFRRIESRSIGIVRQYQSDRRILASAGEVRQVFSNLILNAVDALGPGGTLTLRVREEQREADELLRVEVEDTGSGIAGEIIQKIFEPFFTTKKDVGTGLGLWSAKNLVEKHQGQMLVESAAGITRFTVLLPFETGHSAGSAAA